MKTLLTFSLLWCSTMLFAQDKDWREIPDKVLKKAIQLDNDVQYIGLNESGIDRLTYGFKKKLNPIVSFRPYRRRVHQVMYKMSFDIVENKIVDIEKSRSRTKRRRRLSKLPPRQQLKIKKVRGGEKRPMVIMR